MQFQHPEGEPFCQLETLETRILLSGHDGLVNELFYPEGFAHEGITEVVSITNPSATDAAYELWARYEAGVRDQLLSSGTLGVGERLELDISTAGAPETMLVRSGEPYAFELRSDGQLAATLKHDDFGGATAESFTDDSSDDWSFGTVTKDTSGSHDFIVFYNDNDSSVDVELIGYDDSGEAFRLSKTIQAKRRGGWNIAAESDIAQGVFGVRLISNLPVVTALSHYNEMTGDAFGELGVADGGALAGAILSLEFEDRLAGVDGGDGTPGDTIVSIFNPGTVDAHVDLTFIRRDSDSQITSAATTVSVAAQRRAEVSLASLGLSSIEELSMVYRSDVAVAVHAEVVRSNNTFGILAESAAATQWTFVDSSLDRFRTDGRVRTEDAFVFNPSGFEVHVTFQFVFSNGTVITSNKSLDPLEVEDVDARFEDASFSSTDLSFVVYITASAPVVAGLESWSGQAGGGFATGGLPSGTVVSLADVLIF